MRRIKTFLKKYYFPILTEIAILCIMLFLGHQIVTTEKYKAEGSISPDRYLESFSEYKGDNLANHFFVNTMASLGCHGGALADKRSSCYGLAVQLYNADGNLIRETSPRFLAVQSWPATDNYIIPKYEVLFLEQYFSDKKLDELLKFKRNRWTTVETMIGYYKNKEFIPIEIVFIDGYKPDRKYTLTADDIDTQGKPLEIRYHDGWVILNQLKENKLYSSLDNPTLVSCRFDCYFLNTRPDIQEKVQHELGLKLSSGATCKTWNEPGGYSFHSCYGNTTKQKNITYNIMTCADTTALGWYAALCDTFMVPMWILCQALGIVLIVVYIRLQKKQQKLDETRDTFLNAMAHEMKTPAAVIKNSSECIQAGIQPEKHKHYLEMIEKEADHMNQLLNTMLIYTRTREAAYVLELEEHDILQHAQQTLKHYETLIQQKDIDVQWDVKSSQPFRYDKKLMEMVLDNFFSNAIKFCPEHKTIRITIKENEFSIYNDGATISEENKKRIWEPLFQINTARSAEDNSSSGMGLAISAGILNLHHAVYGVINKLDGVEFYFRF